MWESDRCTIGHPSISSALLEGWAKLDKSANTGDHLERMHWWTRNAQFSATSITLPSSKQSSSSYLKSVPDEPPDIRRLLVADRLACMALQGIHQLLCNHYNFNSKIYIQLICSTFRKCDIVCTFEFVLVSRVNVSCGCSTRTWKYIRAWIGTVECLTPNIRDATLTVNYSKMPVAQSLLRRFIIVS